MADLSVGNWIPSCQSLRLHSKRKRLSRRLGIRVHETIGLLMCLWWWALDEAEDGDLNRFSDQDIADGADWDGTADELVAALAEAGFLTESRVLVNWSKYVGGLIDRREAKREQERLRQQRYRQQASERPAPPGADMRSRSAASDIVTGDSPASHAAAASDPQDGKEDVPTDPPAEPTATPTTTAPAEPPDELCEFDARLRAMPGYNPSADFYRLVLEKYNRLDLNEQAFLMAQWQGDPQRNKKKRKGTTLFVVSWLKRELADAPIQFAARAPAHRNGHVDKAKVAEASDESWDGAMLLDDDEARPDAYLDDAFGGNDGRP